MVSYCNAIEALFMRRVVYGIVQTHRTLAGAIRCPDFVKLTETSARQNQAKVCMMGVKLPAVCKPIVAHGSHDAHVVRGEHFVRVVQHTPCS